MSRHTRIYYPKVLTRVQLDDYLARGWYRIGQSMMTCRFLVFEEVLRTTIWTRLPLAGHRFRKGQRKTLRKLRREFDIRVQRARIDPDRERIYQQYRSEARGDRSPNLRSFLLDSGSRSVFDTWEVSFWRGSTLVAFSWFDAGETSLQSLLGAYPPEESKWGLGYASMLVEIEHGMAEGYAHHYTGYVMPGEPAMDYKLRVGEVEWLDTDGHWRPWSEFDADDTPLTRLNRALEDLARNLESQGIPARVRDYPLFEAASYDASLATCYDEPRLVECFPLHHAVSALFVSYDLDRREYDVERVRRAAGVMRPPDPSVRPRQVELFMRQETLGHAETAEGVLAVIQGRLESG